MTDREPLTLSFTDMDTSFERVSTEPIISGVRFKFASVLEDVLWTHAPTRLHDGTSVDQ